MPPLSLIRDLLFYNEKTGVFFWRVTRGVRKKGAVAGTIDPKGYVSITISKKRYRAHRLAWYYFYGSEPDLDIDHINRKPSDNRISNLRLATKFQNHHNQGVSKNNKTGFKGVHFSQREGKYLSQITINHKRISLGYHNTAEEANQAYLKAAELYQGKFSLK